MWSVRPERLLDDLDDAQAHAVSTPSTTVAVLAGAGSGKTRVLTRRIAFRIIAGTAISKHTLALTFTREAAGELRRRLRDIGLRERVEAGTFHAVALALLRQHLADNNRPVPNVLGDRDRLLAEIAPGVQAGALANEITWAASRGIRPDGYVSAARDAGRRQSIPATKVAAILEHYEQAKRRRGVIDLDDVLTMTARQLAHDSQFAAAVQWRYRHLLVDEAQDLNPIQFQVLQSISRDDVFAVGDPAQAIYGFNGSDPSLLIDIEKRMPGIEIVRLESNHRSTPQIVGAARHVLEVSEQPVHVRSARPDGPGVKVLPADDAESEARLAARLVRSVAPSMLRSGQVAVLARTHSQLRTIDHAMAEAGVAVRRRALAAGSPLAAAVASVTRLGSASRLRAWAHDVLDAPPGDTDVMPTQRRLGGVVLEFLRDHPLGDGAALRSWIATSDPFADHESLGVELLTFHGAKGLEWHTVVVCGVETGLVPHRSASSKGARAEEARLLYVAMTRATHTLYVTHALRRGGYARRPSPLVQGLPVGDPARAPRPTRARDPDEAGPNALERLRTWRERAALAAGTLPEALLSDATLLAVIRRDPRCVEELAEVPGFGPIMAERMFDPIRSVLDGPTEADTAQAKSTTTGA